MSYEEWHQFLESLCLIFCWVDIALFIVLIIMVALINTSQHF